MSDVYENIETSKELVDEYLKIYSSILQSARKFIFDSDIEEKSVIVLRLIYAKTLAFRKLLDGISYNYIDEKTCKVVVEPTTLFVIIRNILELVYVYVYVFVKPNTKEKKEFAYYLYMYTGLKERLAFCEDRDKIENEQIVKTIIKMNEAAERVTESPYFKALSPESQSAIQNVMKKAHPSYRYELGEHEVKQVNYEEACEGIGMTGRFYNRLYAYLSTHAHPTYLSLVQFKEAYVGEKPLHDGFAGLATTLLVSCLSVLFENARKQSPYMEALYQNLNAKEKEMVSYYIQLTHVENNN